MQGKDGALQGRLLLKDYVECVWTQNTIMNNNKTHWILKIYLVIFLHFRAYMCEFNLTFQVPSIDVPGETSWLLVYIDIRTRNGLMYTKTGKYYIRYTFVSMFISTFHDNPTKDFISTTLRARLSKIAIRLDLGPQTNRWLTSLGVQTLKINSISGMFLQDLIFSYLQIKIFYW